jgi:TPR repeat protein
MAAENGCPESRFILYSQAIESEISDDKKEFILNYLRSSADDGFPDAKFELGQLYLNGRFVEKNIEKAKELFYETGKDGHLPSQHFIGMMLLRNKDDESIKNGLSYILTAAEDSYSPSMNMMGELKEYGRHVDKSGPEALQWYFRAADQDDIFAFYNLGRLFLQGKLVQYDYIEGLKYLEMAATENHVKAQYDLGIAYKKGIYGLDKDILLAEYWLNLASKTYTPALLELGDLLLRIGANEKDKYKGIACYKTAIKRGSLQASISLSEIYFNGVLIEKNIPKAITLLKSLSKCNDTDIAKYACYQIGNFYNYGIGVTKNSNEAFKWYCLSSDYGSEEGTAELAKMFISGTNGKRNRLVATALQEKTDINVNGVLLINEMTEHAIAIFDKLLHSLWKTKDTRRTISEFLRSDGSKINPSKRVQKK